MLPVNRLYNIQQQYVNLLGKIEEAEGEITPEIEQALQFTEVQLKQEGASIGAVIKTLEYWHETVEQEIKRLEGIRAKAKKGKELLKNRLAHAMQQFGIERITDPTITISFRKSEAVEINDASAIPAAFLDTPEPTANKIRIKEAIKAGEPVPGAELVQRQNLQIK